MQKTFAIFSLLLLLFGCKDRVRQKLSSYKADTTVQSVVTPYTLPKTKQLSGPEREFLIKEREKEARIDSIRFANVLNRALTYANHNKTQNSFQHKFEMAPDDSSFNVTAQTFFGHLFANDRKHLLVRRTVAWGAICNVYLLEKGKFKMLFEFEQLGMSYINDTLRDVNGDGYKDFLVHWYPNSGCCRRDVYNAFLYQPLSGDFTNNYRFINPTFSPSEKVIRGVGYGHPGEVGLYKYKWNALQVDTIEFIYPLVDQKGKFIKTKRPGYRPDENAGIVLKSLPAEYRNIESIEWFLDY